MSHNYLPFSSSAIPAGHKDLIHDVAYNWYGSRMATCSSDQHVKIWDRDEINNTWVCTASWKTHFGSVWKVDWAHPEFGQVIATCSFDRTAAIWEEVAGGPPQTSTSDKKKPSSSNEKTVTGSGTTGGGHNNSHNWVKRTSLVDSRTSVTDVKFAPRHHGLMLATCSADGIVRVYEATDIMNLSEWSLQHEIPCKIALSCISWNPSIARFHPPMLAIGSDDQSAGGSKVFVYEYNETSRRWLRIDAFTAMTELVHDISFAPNLGRSYHVLAIASKELKVLALKPLSGPTLTNQTPVVKRTEEQQSTVTKYDIRMAGQHNDHGSSVWRVTWNVTGTILATAGDDGQVKLWKSNYKDQWKCMATLYGCGEGGEIPHQPESFPQNV